MSDVDLEDRKLQYLNRSAAVKNDKEQAELDDQYSDVVSMLLGNQPAKGPAFPPSNEEIPLTLASLISAFGAMNVAKGALDAMSAADRAALMPKAPAIASIELATVDVILKGLPLLTSGELNQVLDAMAPLIDAGGAPAAPAVPSELAPGFPAAWRELQWKAKVKLANALGGQAANATEADAYLSTKETEITGKAS